MDRNDRIVRFQEVLDRVARSGRGELVNEAEIPAVSEWYRLESHGCVVRVDRGRWWVLPPARRVA
ncbi:hypothetical protein [Deferrisoma palaeochoriense]